MSARLRPAGLAVALVAAALNGPAAFGQLTGNAFDPYSNAYRSSSYPTFGRNPLTNSPQPLPPGLGLIPGYFPYLGSSAATAPVSPLIPPVNDVNQAPPSLSVPGGDATTEALDSLYNRSYVPNANDYAEGGYWDRQNRRDALYARAIQETDPAKRATLMKQYETYSAQLGTTKARRGGAGAAASRRGTVIRRAPAPRPAATRPPAATPTAEGLPSPVRPSPGSGEPRPAPATTAPPRAGTTPAEVLRQSEALDRELNRARPPAGATPPR